MTYAVPDPGSADSFRHYASDHRSEVRQRSNLAKILARKTPSYSRPAVALVVKRSRAMRDTGSTRKLSGERHNRPPTTQVGLKPTAPEGGASMEGNHHDPFE